MDLDDNLILARTAHELRVPLSLISGSLDALAQYTDAMVQFIRSTGTGPLSSEEQRSLPHESRLGYATTHASEVLEICREGARRLTHVVERLRVSGRREVVALRPVPLAKVVYAAVRVVTHSARSEDVVCVTVDPSLRVVGDADMLGQVFVNLLRNAFDALVDNDAPCIRVEANFIFDDDAPIVEISVRDNGPGVPAALRDRIFDPCFSTKLDDQGVGLGLAIVSDILQSLHGSIRLANAATGAEFVIRLPAHAAPVEPTDQGSARIGR